MKKAIETYEEPPRLIVTRVCTSCGCNGSGSCGRAIQVSDGSVLPLRDTGYRHTPEGKYKSVTSNRPVLV